MKTVVNTHKCGHQRTTVFTKGATGKEIEALKRKCKNEVCPKCESRWGEVKHE